MNIKKFFFYRLFFLKKINIKFQKRFFIKNKK